MKQKKWLAGLLAALLLPGLPVGALADGEVCVPPTVDAAAEVPVQVGDLEIPEQAGEPDASRQTEDPEIPPQIDVPAAEDADQTDHSVAVTLSGAVDAIHTVIYQGTEQLVYFTDSTGTYYNRLDSAGSNERVYVTETDAIPTRLTAIADGTERAQMGFDMRLFLENESDVTVEGATVLKDEMDVDHRCVDILLPDGGSVTVAVAAFGGDVPARIPMTFYNEDWENGVIVGGGSVISGPEAGNFDACWRADDSGEVVSGGSFEVWTGPGYAIEVLEGGTVAETRAPAGAAAESVPAGSICYVLHIDVGAERFVIAAVRQGESYVPGEDITAPAEPESEDVPETEDVPTGEDVPEGEDAPETEDIPEGEDVPEDEDVPETEDIPEVEEIPEDENAPESEDVPEGEDVPEADAATGTFKDVPDNSWYKDIVERAYAAGMVNGVTADAFYPNTTATRGQTVAMIWRQAGSPAGGDVAFTDLTADYYRDAVAWAGWVRAVNGTSRTSFEPDSAITREQLAAILYRMAGSPTAWSGGLVDQWPDGGSVSSFARTAMQWALDNGIINGYADGTLHPRAPATRAEVCAMLLRYSEVVGMYPTEPMAPSFQEQAVSQNVSHTERNLDNPKLIRPKRDKIDDGLYDNGEDGGQWIQQWSETYWDLDRSGEDIMWCTRNLTRMYTGPGVDYDVVYTLYSTYEVSRLGPDENGWTPVVYHEYETGSGFTGWDHTGYVRTDYLSKVVPCHPHVADFSSGPALEAWCHGGIPEGDLYADYGASANGTFYHEEYTPVISGDTYTYTLRGGGHVIIHNVLPEGLVSVEASGEVETHSILLFVGLEKGYGIRASKGYGGGYSLSCSGDYMSCGIDYMVDMSNDEDIEMTMFYGDGAPRVLKATINDPYGGSRMGDGASRFLFLDSNGSVPSYAMAENFFNLKGGYKLKSLSPYATVGKVENGELHHFTVQNLPEGIDQIWFDVVRG